MKLLTAIIMAFAISLCAVPKAAADENVVRCDRCETFEDGSTYCADSETEDFARWICYARNARGNTFWAIGRHPGAVRARALAKCRTYSMACYDLGCRLGANR